MTLTLPKHNRYDYSVIGERKDYSWPGGKRLAFCATTNIEVYAYRRGTGWDPAKKGEPQQQRNYSWRDYGNRVGIWRLFDLFEQFKLPAAHNINSLLYEYHPQITDKIRARGDEVVGARPHQCRAAERSLGARREAADRRRDRGDHEARGQAAEGLDGPGCGRERRHHRSAEGGRLQLRDGLAGGRPAVLAQDPLRADPVGAVSGGAQRLRRRSSTARTPRASSPT